MVEIFKFSSGNQVLLIDGKMFLSYGRELNGRFLISFEDIYKNLYLNEDTFMNTVVDDNGLITVSRVKDYDGEILMAVDKILDSRKGNNVYSTKFDVYESLVIRAIATALMC